MNKDQPAKRILIADDHPVFRHGLRMLLEAEPDFVVVGEAADGAEVIQQLPQVKPDVLLLDLSMPRLPGMEVLRELAASPAVAGTPAVAGRPSLRGRVRTILLTVAIEKEQIIEALQLGARGVVLKDGATELLIKAIRTVIRGQYWVGREAVADLVGYLRRILPASAKSGEVPFQLTRREREIISAVAQGSTNREVAAQLSITEDTVKHHLSNIFDKTGVSTRLELALFAVRHNLADL
jgi:two-component system, NarL family, nitrate/nitrite response regulator NarL